MHLLRVYNMGAWLWVYDGGCSLCAAGQYASGWALACAILQVVYKDLKDDCGFKLSFFAIMIVRAMVFSLRIVAFYSNPLLQAILLMVINLIMLAIWF